MIASCFLHVKHYTAILAFDGVCNLCNALVRFVIRIDKKGKIAFISLQDDRAENYFGDAAGQVNSVLLLHDDKMYYESDAIIKMFNIVGGGWRIINVAKILPKAWRDSLYQWIARNRYKWFGKKKACPLPGPAIADRFL
jgi:predicted DCC family thiol-disulfide oxidoreductase YuxK